MVSRPAKGAEPWERLGGESAQAYAAFRVFRDLGAARVLRNMPPVYSVRSCRRWASDFRWTERAEAWDAERYRLEDAERLEAIRRMGESHRKVARALIAAGVKALEALENGGNNQEPLTPHQAARFVDLGTRLERSALLGESLPPPPAPPSGSGDEDLSPLERIARELAGTA